MAVELAPRPTKRAAPVERRRKPVWDRIWHFATFGGPGTLVYVCFVLAPIVVSFGYSLTNYNPFNPPTKYVKLQNYQLLLHDEAFRTSLKVTTILTSIVVSIIWTRLLDNEGPINQGLRAIGVAHPPGWLADPDFALYSLGWILSWQMLGFCVVVYLAGLQGVPSDLVEAAAIDGAGPIRRFWRITWPLLAPSLTINTVVLLISAFKIFDHVQIITHGGPGTGTTATIAFTVLQEGFDANHYGYASAEAIIMLIIIATASAVTLKLLQRREVNL